MSHIYQPSNPPIWRQALTIVEGLLLLVIATVVFSLLLRIAGLPKSEMAAYLVVKGGFAVILVMVFDFHHGWQRYGFRAGPRFRYWLYLLPLWIGTAVSLAQGFAVTAPAYVFAWILIAAAVAFGEEGLYRGIILDALLPNGPRAAAIISAILFGLSHLIGILQIDYRVVLAQAFFATGLGLTLGWVRLASRSIWPCIFAHTILDASGLLAANGVRDAMRYSVAGMLWVVSFGIVSMAWGVYLIWKKPITQNVKSHAALNLDRAAAMPAASASRSAPLQE